MEKILFKNPSIQSEESRFLSLDGPRRSQRAKSERQTVPFFLDQYQTPEKRFAGLETKLPSLEMYRGNKTPLIGDGRGIEIRAAIPIPLLGWIISWGMKGLNLALDLLFILFKMYLTGFIILVCVDGVFGGLGGVDLFQIPGFLDAYASVVETVSSVFPFLYDPLLAPMRFISSVHGHTQLSHIAMLFTSGVALTVLLHLYKHIDRFYTIISNAMKAAT